MQTVLTGRGCIVGQSGSGKSFLLGVIAEELCRSNMAFCVIDTEGEYSSLKSTFNVIVVGGSNGDVDLNVDYRTLFHASIANDLPIVLDVSDVLDKGDTVNAAIKALYELENEIRKPYLVLIEEADKLAPQIISKKINELEEISVRGRKRGIGLLISTQRPANISKNVLSQCSYGFIGKLTIENDLNSIRILFRDRERLVSITRLGVGEFIPFGLGHEAPFKVKARTVKHLGATPLIDAHRPLNDKINKIIKQLNGDAPQVPKRKTESANLSIYAIPASFTAEDARKYGERVAKRKFGIFGEITEKIRTEVQYLPLGLCTIRIPTGRHEYLEYYTLIDGKSELVRLDRGVGFIADDYKKGSSDKNYKRYLQKGIIASERTDAERECVLKSVINDKKANVCIKKFFPLATLAEFKVIHIPVYKMTFKHDNRVRIFTLDGVYGKEMAL